MLDQGKARNLPFLSFPYRPQPPFREAPRLSRSSPCSTLDASHCTAQELFNRWRALLRLRAQLRRPFPSGSSKGGTCTPLVCVIYRLRLRLSYALRQELRHLTPGPPGAVYRSFWTPPNSKISSLLLRCAQNTWIALEALTVEKKPRLQDQLGGDFATGLGVRRGVVYPNFFLSP